MSCDFLKLKESKCCRDAQGRTPLDILERPQDTPGLSDQLAQVPEGVLDSIKKRLQPKAAGLPRATTATTTASPRAPPGGLPAQQRAVGSVASGAGRMSAAARLQAASTPKEVAEVLSSMPEGDRVHRVKVWAKLPAEKLDEVAGLSSHSKQQLSQVCSAASCTDPLTRRGTDSRLCPLPQVALQWFRDQQPRHTRQHPTAA